MHAENRVSAMSAGLAGSAILKVAAEIRELQAAGRDICNLTVGDFTTSIFPVPEVLATATADALQHGETNYPPAPGIPQLRAQVANFYRETRGLEFTPEQILITAGARPAIYCAFRVLLDPGERVIFSVPSWNNPYYAYMVGAEEVPIHCDASTSFLPTRSMLEREVRNARMVALNSPLNPTGTAFDAETLRGICELIVEENTRRSSSERPLFLLYDQIYWLLTFHGVEHADPISLVPEIKPYTILVDGISKHFAATGMRVGWAAGPADVIRSMSDLNGHMGAWAPRAEQQATIKLLADPAAIKKYHATMIPKITERLDALRDGLLAMKADGLAVDATEAMGAIYLSARFDLIGRRTPAGAVLNTNEDIRSYLLHAAGFAVVPFQAFAVNEDTGWFRLSAGAVTMEQVHSVLPRLKQAIAALT